VVLSVVVFIAVTAPAAATNAIAFSAAAITVLLPVDNGGNGGRGQRWWEVAVIGGGCGGKRR
jgi:hypothetical protein